MSTKNIHEVTVHAVAKKIRIRGSFLGKWMFPSIQRRQAMNRGEIGSVLAHADPADKREAKRGFENVDAEIQAKHVQFESLFAPHGDAEHT